MKKRKVSLEKKRSLRSLKQNWTLLLLLLPACVMILVFNYVPMYGIQAYLLGKSKEGANEEA